MLPNLRPHFKNTNLTKLLQPCFEGDGKALLLVTVRAEPEFALDSKMTLNFAAGE